MADSYSGALRKMQVQLAEPVEYTMVLGEQKIPVNRLIGQKVEIQFDGIIRCIHCNRVTKKSFNQGYCYPCFSSLAQCDSCIIHPERCHYEEGSCRDPGWADKFCMQDHIVYLANSSGLKVGITRGSQIPTRWIDQGAVQALPIYRVSSRAISGYVEVVFKQYVKDRTDWRAMLKGVPAVLDLQSEAAQLRDTVASQINDIQSRYGIQSVQVCEADAVSLSFPVEEYPEKVKSHNLDKTPVVSGVLKGIKGQYLLMDSGVINLRKYGGYEICFVAG